MKAFFKSPALQKEFDEDGFIKLKLLSFVQVKELLTAYESVAEDHKKIKLPYITTSHSNDAALINYVDNILNKVMAPEIDKYLTNYNLLFGNYLIKMPGDGSETSPHQDITFVDESQFVSANIWVALEDINEENGCMYFLKGSHTLRPTLRPTHSYPWAYEHVADEIKLRSEQFEAKAGEAFIFNHAVIHGSLPNKTTQPRIAAVMAAYHSEARLLHYYLPEGEKSTVKKYSMIKEDFLHFVKGAPPATGVLLDEVNYEFDQLNIKEFRVLLKHKGKTAGSFFSILKKWIQ